MFLLIALSAMQALQPAAAPTSAAPVAMFKATQSGGRTLDEGESGGNPFASALIRSLSQPSLDLRELPAQIRLWTSKLSGGFQEAEVPMSAGLNSLNIARPAARQRREALILVFADYSAAPGLMSLPGAARDARRIRKTLRAAGFAVRTEVDPARSRVGAVLSRFAATSASADVALIYSTGHGIEVNGRGYVLPGDYPVWEGNGALGERALPLDRVAASLRARTANLFFFGGCRDNPFGR